MESTLTVQEKLKYDESEVDQRRGLFMANQNKYLTKKYPQLKDAEVVKASNKSRSVLDCVASRSRKSITKSLGSFVFWAAALMKVK